ncbi:MAG: HAD-IA family hydrolase [Bacilli bacterium]|nr:HAD-IA family hydrolase [Bacilli bacterium]
MVKVIAFDLVGVLVSENDFELNEVEDRLERFFGKNISNEEFYEQVKHLVPDRNELNEMVNYIIFSIYDIRVESLFETLKHNYPDIKIVIATNHVSMVKDYITKHFDFYDEVFISADINKIKPNSDFYEHILNKMNIETSELLFLDDSIENIDGAIKLGINTIKVNKDTDILKEIELIMTK